jgi:Predicted periplasmic protein (DUF2092)
MSMKMHESVLVTSLVALLVVPTVGCGGAAETAAVTSTATVAAAPAMTDAEARALMVKAAEVSKKFTSYHASATFTKEDGNMKMEADLLGHAIDVIVNAADGATVHYIGVGEDSLVSTDGDATWGRDTLRRSDVRVFSTGHELPQILADAKLVLSVVGKATVDGVETTHLSFKTPHAPAEVWIAEHAELGPYVKRTRHTPEAGESDAEVIDITYSKFNEPFDIRLPGVS